MTKSRSDTPTLASVRGVLHAPGCNCKPAIHRFACRCCQRVVGWCLGADDAIERERGPICDECAAHYMRRSA